MNEFNDSFSGTGKTISAFDKMEEKINRELDEAMAMSELNKNKDVDIKDLAKKYDADSSVDQQLDALKAGADVEAELEALKNQVNKA